MREIKLTSKARADLLEIWHFVAPDNPRAADRFLARINAKIEHLAFMPSNGHSRPDIRRHACLAYGVGKNHVILYRFSDDDIHVLRVLNGRRNLRRLLRAEPL